jgi:hypothetical protein
MGFLLTSLTGHPLLLLKMQFLFWTLAGMLVSLAPQKMSTSKRLSVPAMLLLLTIILLPFSVYSSVSSPKLSSHYGYHDWEFDGQTTFRWTGAEAISFIKPEGSILKMAVSQPDWRLKRPLRTEVYLNDELLDLVYLSDTNWHSLEYYLPELQPQERMKLVFRPEKTFNPIEHGRNDPRDLGIGISSLYWESTVRSSMGFHFEEIDSNRGSFRWTKRRAALVVQVSGPELIIPLRANPEAIRTPLGVTVFWNEKIVKKITLTDVQWHDISLRLPKTSSKGILGFKVNHTCNPERAGFSNDNRDLGVSVGPFRWVRDSQ